MMRWLTILLLFTSAAPAVGQQAPAPDDEMKSIIQKLPPLQRILDSTMRHSPLLQQQDHQVTIRQLQLERKRTQWLEYFNIETFVQYGNNASYITNSFDSGINNNLNTTATQTRYGVGFIIKYPIFNLFSRGKDKAIARHEIVSASLQRQIYEQDLRKSIIELYNQVLLSHALLEAKLEALQMSNLAVSQSEIDFKQSKISVNELSKIADANMKNITEYQTALSELRLSLDLLQELSGYNFLKQ
jgi:outer membrane protein TolC